MKAAVGIKNDAGFFEWFSDDLPDPLLHPRKSSPWEFEERKLLVFRDEKSGKIFVGEGVRVKLIESGEFDSSCYRVEIDRDEVVGIINEDSGENIPLTTKRGKRIIEELAETNVWAEVDGKSLRFEKVDLPVMLAML